jgi:N-acetylmuramoyl-L-alanine amidase
VIDAQGRFPFEVTHTAEPLAFELRFFGASQRFDRVRHAAGDPVVRDIRWRQESSRVAAVSIDTSLRWGWGYDAYYDERGRFVLELRRPPDLSGSGNVLAGRRVVVDPGHGPDPGALGPLRTTEREVNLAIGLSLRKLLEAEGAQAVLLRDSESGPALADRGPLAWEKRGEVYVSVHNNALPNSADPFESPRGFSMYYYHSHSRQLADAVYSSYRKRHADLGNEGVHWGDLAVCRTTQMPAILTESAYVILPRQEALLRDPAYQERLARTILEGLIAFYESYRELQARSPAEMRAAREKSPWAGRAGPRCRRASRASWRPAPPRSG